jgi:hypothetical protein
MVFAAAAAVYAAMLLWTLPEIQTAAAGLVPFDMRPFGYSHTEALDFLTALSPQGLALYLGPQRWLDLAYPALLGTFLAWSFVRLGPGILPRAFLVVVAVAGTGFDYLENIRVRAMLLAGPEATTQAMSLAASLATMVKSGLVAFSLVMLVLLVLWRGLRWLRRAT